MDDQPIKIVFDSEKNLIITTNLTNKPIKIDYWIVELDTNLTFLDYWVAYGANQYHYYPLPSWYDFHKSNGFEIKAYIENTLIQSQKIQFFNKKSENYFHVTRQNEHNYPSWRHLMIDNHININLNKDDVFYDLGANIGVYTMWAKLNKVRQVYSFEPNPTLVNDMRKTFAEDVNINIYQKAISHEHDVTEFTINPQSICSGFYQLEGTRYPVEQINLERFYKENDLLPPTVIKCDIEGSEYLFMSSVSDDFLKTVRAVIFEFHFFGGYGFEHLSNIMKRFISLGYNIKRTKDTRFENNMGCLIFNKDDSL
jgi:FkbM family methyltransferase